MTLPKNTPVWVLSKWCVKCHPNKSRVGAYAYKIDSIVKGSSTSHRAVLEIVEVLCKAGRECVQINTPDGV
jgi:hypothetical protein